MELAQLFASPPAQSHEEEGIGALPVLSKSTLRQGGFHPMLIQARSKDGELREVLEIVQDLLNGAWAENEVDALVPSDIAILYRHLGNQNRAALESLIRGIRELPGNPPVIWLTEPNENRQSEVTRDGVKVGTIFSSKGLQFRAVIVLFANECPAGFPDTTEASERKLFYVALTRAEEYLVITQSGMSSFTDEILKHLNIEWRGA